MYKHIKSGEIISKNALQDLHRDKMRILTKACGYQAWMTFEQWIEGSFIKI